jgi:hypothetical protein
MYVGMPHALPSGFTNVDANVVAIRLMLRIKHLLAFQEKLRDVFTLGGSEIEITGYVPDWNDQEMARAHRKPIEASERQCILKYGIALNTENAVGFATY